MTVTGNQRYPAEAIVKELGLVRGQHVNTSVIEAARVKLQNLQIFSSVADRYRFTLNPVTYDITFEVKELEQVFPVRFERLNVSSSELREYLMNHLPLYSDEIPGTEAVLNRYREAVQTFVSHADPAVKVRVSVSNEDPQKLAVVFAPDAPVPTISRVIITGNDAVDTGTLLRSINLVAIGAPYTDIRMKQILDGAVRPVYAARGYVAISFPSVEAEPSKTDKGVVVKLQIKEGPLFKFGAIRFHGSGLEEDEVRSAIPFKPGQSYNAGQVDDFRIDLQHRLRRRGYLDASVLFQTQPDEAHRVVNVVYNVTPGSIYTFAKLDVKGLDITTEPVIEQLWGEKPGKPFNPDYPDFFLKRVQEDKVFDHLSNTTSDYTADEASHSVTVHLYFKGGESKDDKEKKKREDEERKKADGTWSPYP